MSKQAKLKRRRSPANVRRGPSPASQKVASPSTRIPALDALRGLAILLMIVDHVSGILFSVNIEYTTIRFATRLSMPLFAVLMGYFLDTNRPLNPRRFGQIALAMALVNIAYLQREHELEILASLLIAYIIFYVMKTSFPYAYLLIFIAPWDASAWIFDYPLALVIPCVALGNILRHARLRWAVANSLLALTLLFWLEPPTKYALYFLTPAVLLVAVAVRFEKLRFPPLEFLGRHPLTIYVAQYYAILASKLLIG